MSNWTDGYVTDLDYTFGYYQELNPLRVRLAFLNAGLVCPEMGTACEIGFGQGVSANLHAAGSTVQWCGTDFNPTQAGFAQQLAQASGAGARLYDQAFADFAKRSDLPDFDFIGVHGIWSWISDENRAVIVDFVGRKLKVGGVLYISYNTLPGWAAFEPMRHLMSEHAQIVGAKGQGMLKRVNAAIEFADRLLATNPVYARANPQVAERLKKIRGQDRHYLVHEYFGGHWHPVHFATMAACLHSAKLSYACSANYLDSINGINITAEQQTFLSEITDPLLRESVRDFMVNQQFRKDYWVKGARRLSNLDQAELFRSQRVMLSTHRADVPMKVSGALGEAGLTESVYTPLLELLADHKARTLGAIEQALKDRDISFAQVIQAILLLSGMGHLSALQDEAVLAKARAQTDRLNAHLIDKARGSGEVNYLASPLTGGGVPVGRFGQLFLQAVSQGKKLPSEWAGQVWQLLQLQGQKVLKDGKTLETPEENLAELNAQASAFAEKQLPVLRALQVG